MTTEELLALLSERGARLSAVAGRLRVDAPAGVISDELKQSLRDHKEALLAHAHRSTTTDIVSAPTLDLYASSLPHLDQLHEQYARSGRKLETEALEAQLTSACLAENQQRLLRLHDCLLVRLQEGVVSSIQRGGLAA